MKRFLLILFLFSFTVHSYSQFTRYIVRLKDKNGTAFSFANPAAYLSQRAIDRRARYSLPIDSTDLPVNPSYVTQVKNVSNVTVLNVSKWLNAITIQTTDPAALTTINGFSFVKSVGPAAARLVTTTPIGLGNSKFESNSTSMDMSAQRAEKIAGDFYNYGTTSFNEIHLHNGEFLHNIGLRGQSMQIALLDNGFNNFTSASFHAFDSVNATNRVLGTWDFVAREQNVSNDGSHGMSCFSTIAANIPGQFIGKAPQASFWLYQTEDNASEQVIEEFNWACGAEAADSSGADIISSSLGYTTFDSVIVSSVKTGNPNDHVYADMNGNTTMAAIAADLAAKKGLLIFIANGNDGADSWHFLSTPADGDSVIAVGAVNTAGVVGSFSSFGPSSDNQVKPDLASIGVSAMVQTSGGGIGLSNGTSFATPNLAGLGTCLWQGFPEFSNMKIRAALWQSGSIANTPDTRIGYGIPDMKKAFTSLLHDFSTATGSVTNCKTTLNWTSKDVSAMRYEIERKVFGESVYSKIADVPAQSNVAVLSIHNYQQADTLINVQAGTVSYRVRAIVDTTATGFAAAYIDTVDIALASSCVTTGVPPVNPNADRLSIIPNPAPDQFTLRVETNYPVNKLGIFIVDMKGRTMMRLEKSKTTGTANFDIAIPQLARGKYVVAVYNGTQLLASKEMIKL